MNIKIVILILLSCLNLNSELLRDDNREIVHDSETKLEWLDISTNTNDTYIWIESIKYCETLKLDGGSWRLPNKKELSTIVDFTTSNPSISDIFQDRDPVLYWTSTTYISSKSSAFGISFFYGASEHKIKTSVAKARCVKTRGEEE